MVQILWMSQNESFRIATHDLISTLAFFSSILAFYLFIASGGRRLTVCITDVVSISNWSLVSFFLCSQLNHCVTINIENLNLSCLLCIYSVSLSYIIYSVGPHLHLRLISSIQSINQFFIFNLRSTSKEYIPSQ